MEHYRVEILKAKELRGNIIESLYNLYPQEVTINTLKQLLRYKGYTYETEVQRAMYYLQGKGYISLVANEGEVEYWENEIVLTPLGINLAEGDADDMGVNLNV